MFTRRFAISSAVAAAVATLSRRSTLAQFTEQEVSNGLQVTATGNVHVDQAASGQQDVGVFVNGQPVDNGIFRTTTGQVVVNDGQITATGDVTVSQSASGTQTVRSVSLYDGAPADRCDPGHVIADPTTGQLYYQGNDCCYYLSPCCGGRCKGKGC
jgi:hypothetical protein